jgi:hypothetical protein
MELAPVHDPEYNRELIVKELLLLERHLNIPEEWCMEDCIPNHLLRAEALAEEAIRLGGGGEFQQYAQEVRRLRKALLGSKDHGHSHSPEGVEVGEKVWVEHITPKEACDPRSFRTVKPNPEHILTVCCPAGQYDEASGKCRVGVVGHKLEHLHPKEGGCQTCGG